MSVLRFRRGPHSQRQKVPPAAAIIDEFTRERLAIRIDRKLRSTDFIDALSDLFILRGVPGQVRSDNGPEFIATRLLRARFCNARTAESHPLTACAVLQFEF